MHPVPRHTALATLVLTVLVTTPLARADEPLDPTEGSIERVGQISGFTSDSAGHHSVNNYWIHGEDGVVVIDAHWRLSDAERALTALRAETDAPVRALLLTHPHTDHFGGASVFLDAAKDVAYFSTPWGTRSIRNDEQGFVANRQDQFGEDFPAEVPVPRPVIESGVPLEISGITLEPVVLRQNEAVETVVLYLAEERALFTGDLVNAATMPVFYQGGLDSWLEQLDELQRRFPSVETIYPGHGEPGDFDELLGAQIALLEAHRDLVATALDGDGRVDDDERTRIADAIEQRFPDAKTTAGVPARRKVIDLNIDWILRGWRVTETGAGDAQEFRQQ